jgi:hypothetical protein
MLAALKGVAFTSWFLVMLGQGIDPAMSAVLGWIAGFVQVRAALALALLDTTAEGDRRTLRGMGGPGMLSGRERTRRHERIGSGPH